MHFWGEIKNTGLHFIPAQTTLIQGISMAGGAKPLGVLESVRVTRSFDKGKIQSYSFDLTEGGSKKAYNFELTPQDTVFIKKSHFLENRVYYTSLIRVIATPSPADLRRGLNSAIRAPRKNFAHPSRPFAGKKLAPKNAPPENRTPEAGDPYQKFEPQIPSTFRRWINLSAPVHL